MASPTPLFRQIALAFLALVGSVSSEWVQATPAIASPTWKWNLPAGFPPPAVPPDNPMSTAKVTLGHYLFYEKRLSGNGTIMCASCHFQKLAFSDGLRFSRGSTGEQTARSAQALMNVAWNASYTWANPALLTLESQMSVPLFGENPVEMGVNDSNKQAILTRLKRNRHYRRLFNQAFPNEISPVGWRNIIRAIASFERSLISGASRFDLYQQGREKLTLAETRGKDLFFGEKAECFHCHGGFNFSDQTVHARSKLEEMLFHNTGLYNIGGTGSYPDGNRGIYELSSRSEDMGKFRAPSLRNIALTAPYMHDGSFSTLQGVLAFYAAGGKNTQHGPFKGDGRLNPYKSELIGNMALSKRDQLDIIAFLKTLTDTNFMKSNTYGDPFQRYKHR